MPASVRLAPSCRGRADDEGSPSRVKTAIKVGASTIADEQAVYSNFGKCVDIHAPGTDIDSAYFGTNDEYVYKTGTSMSTPHVAGLATMLLSHGDMSTAQLKAKLVSLGVKNVLKNVCAFASVHSRRLDTRSQEHAQSAPQQRPSLSPTLFRPFALTNAVMRDNLYTVQGSSSQTAVIDPARR